MMVEGMHKKPGHQFPHDQTKRVDGEAYVTTALFTLPRVLAIGLSWRVTLIPVICSRPSFRKSWKVGVNTLSDQGGNPRAMMVYPADMEMGDDAKPLAASAGWAQKPEAIANSTMFSAGCRWASSSRARARRRWAKLLFIAVSLSSCAFRC